MIIYGMKFLFAIWIIFLVGMVFILLSCWRQARKDRIESKIYALIKKDGGQVIKVELEQDSVFAAMNRFKVSYFDPNMDSITRLFEVSKRHAGQFRFNQIELVELTLD